jgi:hypothetical protein
VTKEEFIGQAAEGIAASKYGKDWRDYPGYMFTAVQFAGAALRAVSAWERIQAAERLAGEAAALLRDSVEPDPLRRSGSEIANRGRLRDALLAWQQASR